MIFENKDFFDIFNIENYKNESESENFEENYQIKPNFNALIFQLLFLYFIMCIYSYLNRRNFLTDDIVDMFFESRETKKETLETYLEHVY